MGLHLSNEVLPCPLTSSQRQWADCSSVAAINHLVSSLIKCCSSSTSLQAFLDLKSVVAGVVQLRVDPARFPFLAIVLSNLDNAVVPVATELTRLPSPGVPVLLSGVPVPLVVRVQHK